MDIIALGVSLLSGNGLKTAVGGDRDENRENGIWLGDVRGCLIVSVGQY